MLKHTLVVVLADVLLLIHGRFEEVSIPIHYLRRTLDERIHAVHGEGIRRIIACAKEDSRVTVSEYSIPWIKEAADAGI